MQTFTVVLSPNPSAGGCSVSVPAVPGALSEGDSRGEALANIREALEGVLEVMDEDGQTPLRETPELIATEIAVVLGFRAEEGWDIACGDGSHKPSARAGCLRIGPFGGIFEQRQC